MANVARVSTMASERSDHSDRNWARSAAGWSVEMNRALIKLVIALVKPKPRRAYIGGLSNAEIDHLLGGTINR